MGVVDIREWGDEFVIHYQTENKSINAYTFSASLIALADSLRVINRVANPGYEIEVLVEALGPGSFRAKIRTAKEHAKNLFGKQSVAFAILIGLLTNYIYDEFVRAEDKVEVEVKDGSYIIKHNGDSIILPVEVLNEGRQISQSKEVRDNVAQLFTVLEKDTRIQGVGFVGGMDSSAPIAVVPRRLFSMISAAGEPVSKVREHVVEATLQITRAILEQSNRRWEFVWNGFKISAPVLDKAFYQRFYDHSIVVAPGDALRVILRVNQKMNDSLGIYMNDNYDVLEVLEHIPRYAQTVFPNFDS